MKIALLTGVFPKLSETFVLNQITGLLDRGHDVTIFANQPGESGKVHPDVEAYGLIERTHYWPSSVGSALKRGGLSNLVKGAKTLLTKPKLLKSALGNDLKDSKFDVIYCHFGHIGERARQLRNLGVLEGKLVVTFHAYDITVLLGEQGDNYYDELFKEVDLLLPISHLWENRLVELGADPKTVKVHRMGIDLALFEFQNHVPEPGEPVRLVSIARLVEKKGIEYAIRALAHVKDAMPAYEYHVVGDGPLRAELEALAVELGVGDAIKFRGWMAQDELIRELDQAHVLLTPSVTAANRDMEGLPVAIMEGMANGLPVISTRHSGIPELIRHEENGLLADERDWRVLGELILRMATDSELARTLAVSGREAVAEQHDIHQLNDTLAELLEGI